VTLRNTPIFNTIVLALAFLTASCSKKPFDAPQKLGGDWVSAKHLNLGWETYNNYCMQCHGVLGDGLGPAAQGMVPAPRDFRQGIYKFGNVSLGELPTDEDFARIIRYGLDGTAMLPWDISDQRLDAVTQYIKTFSPKWREEGAGTVVEFAADPWGPLLTSQAIEQGKRIYHGLAQCYTCHPAYVSTAEISTYAMESTGQGMDSIRENPHLSILQGSSFGHSYMPPDFTQHHIRTSRNVSDTYKRLVVGVNGTTMPAWRGMLSLTGDTEEDEKNLWALAYYVQSLQDLKWDWRSRMEFFQALNAKRGSFRAATGDSQQP
jgi:mono/diheme cytochrome c family protein